MRIRKLAANLAIMLLFLDNGEGLHAREEPDGFRRSREVMVENQIKARGIKDKNVLSAILKVKRHEFVSPGLTAAAYEDHPLSIGEGQTISQPYIVALMTELLGLRGNEKVLEVGTGCGYQAAVLGELAGHVYTMEIIPALAKRAARLLESLGYRNISVKCGDGYSGWPEHAPFDAIIVTCAAPQVPEPLIEQLAEGGRMVMPIGTMHQELVLFKKKDGRVESEVIIPVIFVPMTRQENFP